MVVQDTIYQAPHEDTFKDITHTHPPPIITLPIPPMAPTSQSLGSTDQPPTPSVRAGTSPKGNHPQEPNGSNLAQNLPLHIQTPSATAKAAPSLSLGHGAGNPLSEKAAINSSPPSLNCDADLLTSKISSLTLSGARPEEEEDDAPVSQAGTEDTAQSGSCTMDSVPRRENSPRRVRQEKPAVEATLPYLRPGLAGATNTGNKRARSRSGSGSRNDEKLGPTQKKMRGYDAAAASK